MGIDVTTPPAKMTAIAIAAPGGPEVLTPAETPTPAPGPGQALLKVAAAGVNRPDVFQRLGLYPPPPGAPETPGLEVAGEVVALGAGAHGLEIGDCVCALTAGGGYAEYCVIDAALALPVPDGLSLMEAASLPETFFTVWTNIFDDACLTPGETLLVHGGTSGVGVAAIQLAKTFGARVFTTCGNDAKCYAAKELGADHAINYRTERFEEVVKAQGGADVILDMVAGDYVARNLACLKPRGRIALIAFLGGSRIEADLMGLMVKRQRISGSTLRARPLREKAMIAQALKTFVWPRITRGEIGAVIDSVFPLSEAAKAHARMETGGHIGKIMLDVQP